MTKTAKKEVCGHINKHSFGVDGKPDNPVCFLKPGHDGLHRGKHFRRTFRYEKSGKQFLAVPVEDVEEDEIA